MKPIAYLPRAVRTCAGSSRPRSRPGAGSASCWGSSGATSSMRKPNVLESIGTGADGDNKVDENGNLFRYRGWASFKANNETKDARLRDIYDIYLVKQ